MFIAGVQALGLIDKHLMSPPQRLLEDKTLPVLDMNQKYENLSIFLSTSNNVPSFITGEFIPFPEVPIKQDANWHGLVKSANSDAETISILQCFFSALSALTLCVVKDQLPGWWCSCHLRRCKQKQLTSAKQIHVLPQKEILLSQIC